jgi:hypothetical protein
MRNRVRTDYARVWRRVCVEWLGWPQARFDRFVRAFNAKLEATDDGATWFYHEPALYHIMGLLVTDEFEERLHREVRKARYGTPEWVYFRRELLDTIEGSPLIRGKIDWTSARERAEEYLSLYRQRLPSPKTVTNYEKWVLSYEPTGWSSGRADRASVCI